MEHKTNHLDSSMSLFEKKKKEPHLHYTHVIQTLNFKPRVSTMSKVDIVLKEIISSTKSTEASVKELIAFVKDSSSQHPELVRNLLAKSNLLLEGVSLLGLKNESLVSYINNIVLVVLSHLERLESDLETGSSAVERSIIQRVTLEKGVKPLEKKLSYQLDKMIRAYGRMEQDEIKAEQKLNDRGSGENDENDENDSEEDSEEDSEDDSEDDELAYRPDASSFAKLTSAKTKLKPTSSAVSTSNEKYRPPKISAMAPPTAVKSHDIDSNTTSSKNRKLQSMEEYLQEQSDMPMVEASVGSTIVEHGRGGVKTQHDRKKEREIQTYEEDNFVRLPTSQTKKSFKEKQRDIRNQFAGEDWSMFNNNKDVTRQGTSRKRKATTVWDKVKKKKNT